ncbi:DUF1795 domain-containing protein [Paenibacillus pinistramenti]|uniref:DUF1795 domain-containing protein n=1 Tax=Paenibacillus pinistramenti TaxID=1768003 RepID=UPI0011098ACE|nr:DUF1795 domain-containing protein [Paenibacillus pinistramenti]
MKQAEFRLAKLAVAAAAGTLLLTGCGMKRAASDEIMNESRSKTESLAFAKTAYSGSQAGIKIEDASGSLSLTLPQGWKKDDSLNRSAALAVSDRAKEKYCLVVPVSSNILKNATVDSLKKKMLADTKVALQNYHFVGYGETTIDGIPAQTAEFYGTARNVDVHYLTAVMKKGSAFYQIITWSTSDLFEGYKKEFENVIQSFRIVNSSTPEAAISVMGSAPSAISLVTSSDQQSSITIPEGWTRDTALADSADIQASRPASEDYLVVLREDRSDFSKNTTINDYSNLVSTNMKQSIQNPQQDKPRQITVGGLSALQYVISGEVGKVKISYLVTLVASEDHFTQVLLWTRSDMFAGKKQNYLYIVNTFREM